ncbi:conserved protein of unknown function [Candidatus Promineifilum breve]|uniref:PD-(D/E)XK nuclease domain-containing protein n=1 Tax=Candidatus Promineifilum breve TaxID=1806508 RepID=A0A170PG76_9CHLR|nr:PD-(D/E)XK nuclease superfamily protein [Candidatus Promineifilum breve]CUS03603.2 conserved protein of unknown function [Candidatus Promineifilum breve]
MAGKGTAVKNGNELKRVVVETGESLGLVASTEVKVGRRIWGAVRNIDVVLTDPLTRQRIGLECKYQGSTGSAEEKVQATLEDIRAWPIRGLVVIAGPGFSQNMRGYLISTGSVIDIQDLSDWLRLYFGLP